MMKRAILVLSCFFVVLLLGRDLQSKLPLFANWDMDLITTVDALQSQEQRLPQHINHTAFGMNLAMHWLVKLLPPSAENMSQVTEAPLPLLVMYEATSMLRQTAPVVCSLIISFLILCWTLQKTSSLILLGLGLVTLTLPSLWNFQFYLIRTEQWSALYFCIAFVFLVCLREMSRFKRLFWSGFFIFTSIALLTKYQGLFLVFALLLIAFDQLLSNRKLKTQNLPMIWKSKIVVCSVLIVFLILSLASLFAFIPHHFAKFVDFYFPNLFFILTLFCLSLPLVVKIFHFHFSFVRVHPQEFLNFVGVVWWFALFLCLVFGAHFLFSFSNRLSWEYLLFDWKMFFLRWPDHAMSAAKTAEPFLWNLKTHGLIFLVWMLFAWMSLKNNRYILKKMTVIFYFLLILLSLKFVSRGLWQDALWNDLLILFGFVLVLPKFSITKFKSSLLFSALMIVFVSHLFFIFTFDRESMESAVRHSQEEFYKEPYESPEILYTETLKRNVLEKPKYLAASQLIALHLPEVSKALKMASPELNLKHVDYLLRDDQVLVLARKNNREYDLQLSFSLTSRY